MVFSIACGDVLPGCPARFQSTDRDELLHQVAEHAAEAHGLRSITPELRAEVESKIVTS